MADKGVTRWSNGQQVRADFHPTWVMWSNRCQSAHNYTNTAHELATCWFDRSLMIRSTVDVGFTYNYYPGKFRDGVQAIRRRTDHYPSEGA